MNRQQVWAAVLVAIIIGIAGVAIFLAPPAPPVQSPYSPADGQSTWQDTQVNQVIYNQA